jgi:hypothetical protein
MKRFLSVVLACIATIGVFPQTADACSVPVFRYALERWQPDHYLAVLFHDGELTKDQKSLLDRLSGDKNTPGGPANIEILAVDTSKPFDDDADLTALWKTHAEKAKQADGPWLVVRFPEESAFDEDIWSGELTKKSVDAIRVSPVRTELSKRLLAGDSVVWLVIESGDKQADAKFVKRLTGDLKLLQKKLKLPELDPADDKYLSADGPALKLAFSVLTVSRTDAREKILLDSILYDDPNMPADERKLLAGPLAVPIFGRGRALAVMPAARVLPEVLEDAAGFLCGPCSCQVKQQNPGWDLLVATDWQGRISGRIARKTTIPELTSPLAGVTIDDGRRDEVALLGTHSDKGFELSSGGYLAHPDENGIIHRFDTEGQPVEARRPTDDNYSLWKDRLAEKKTATAAVIPLVATSPAAETAQSGHEQSARPLIRNLTLALSAFVLLVIVAGIAMQLSRKPA